MAPPSSVTAGRLQAAADRAAQVENKALPLESRGALSCTFIGTPDGTAAQDARLTCRAEAVFEWKAVGDGLLWRRPP